MKINKFFLALGLMCFFGVMFFNNRLCSIYNMVGYLLNIVGFIGNILLSINNDA